MPKRQVSARIDEALLRVVRRQLKARSDSEALQMALERTRDETAETRRMKNLLRRFGGKGGPDAFRSIDPRRS
ncbi:MAG: hypothetical protein EXR72_02655 [Myxococcales bacterium]|nr:hypothetical protein [Myxococcales bacterium]